MPVAIEGIGTPEAEWRQWQGWPAIPLIAPQALLPPNGRVVVVAPHPDDEILGCGALLAALAARGAPVVVVAVTDGTASHPGSPWWTAERLGATRPDETRTALELLGVADHTIIRLGVPDGHVCAHEGAIAHALRQIIRPGDALLTTWREDGHPDHEATGRACATANQDRRARLLEVPIWAWHWSTPGDARIPWERARRVQAQPRGIARKRLAIAAFRSQTEPDPATGAAPILPAHVIERFLRPFEMVFL